MRFFFCVAAMSFSSGWLFAAKADVNYDEAKVLPYKLPDPLVLNNGTPVRDAVAWRAQRRPELLELFSREVYGRTPIGRPAKMHWAVTKVDRAALGGKAVRKEVTVWFTEKKDGPKMHLLIYQPPGNAANHAPWPAFLGLNYYGNQCVNADPGITMSTAWMRKNEDNAIVDNRATELTRGSHASRWNVESVVARGYATATMYYGDLCEDRVEGLSKDVAALFGQHSVDDRKPDAPGAIGVWAWGLSRRSITWRVIPRSTGAAWLFMGIRAWARPRCGRVRKTNDLDS